MKHSSPPILHTVFMTIIEKIKMVMKDVNEDSCMM